MPRKVFLINWELAFAKAHPTLPFSTGSGLAVGSACWLVGFGLTVVRTGPDVRGLSAKILPYPFFLSLNSTVPAKGKV